MKNHSFLILLILLLPGVVLSQADPEPTFKRFPTHPPLQLLLADSSTLFTEKELKKNTPLLFIMFSPDCDHCQMETEEMIREIDKLKDFQIVMATMLPFEKMRAFYLLYELHRFKNITVGWDKNFILPPFYRIKSLPFHAFYDKNGKLIDVFEGALTLEKVLDYFKN